MLSHKTLGAIIHDWQLHGAIALKVKILSSALLLSTMSYSILWKENSKPLTALLLSIMSGALLFIWSRPSRQQTEIEPSSNKPNKL